MRGPRLYLLPNKPLDDPTTAPSRPWGEGAKPRHAPWVTDAEVASGHDLSPKSGAEFRSHFHRLAGYPESNDNEEIGRNAPGMKDNVKMIARPAANRSLREAIRNARLEEAERLDATADARDGEIARLELLKAELETVFAEIPRNDERFNLVLAPSHPARLWIDLFTYVAIDDSSGAYLFIRNSDSGRRTLFSANTVAEMADRITTYMAQEIVRRERMEAALLETAPRKTAVSAPQSSGPGTGVVLAAFIIGVITGAAGLFAAVWLSVP
jgi:hypothetical protein